MYVQLYLIWWWQLRKGKEIANETPKEETLQKVMQSINSGHKIFPKPYSIFVDELTVVDRKLIKQ